MLLLLRTEQQKNQENSWQQDEHSFKKALKMCRNSLEDEDATQKEAGQWHRYSGLRKLFWPILHTAQL